MQRVASLLRNTALVPLLSAVFALLLLTSVAFTSYLLISSGKNIVNDVLSEVATDTTSESTSEINKFLRTPDIINQNISRAIRSGRVDINDNDSLLSFFWDAAERESEYSISAIYFAAKSGNFLGLDSNALNKAPEEWEIIHSSSDTNGLHTVYEPQVNGIMGRMKHQGKPYDPRKRPWYLKALKYDNQAVWTNVYLDFGTQIPTITRAITVEGTNGTQIGVAGVDLFLDHIREFLGSLSISDKSEVFIVNGEGLLLAAYGPAYPRTSFQNIKVAESTHRYTAASAKYFQDTSGQYRSPSQSVSDHLELDGEEGFLNITPIGNSQGLDWSLGVFIPASDYLGNSASQFKKIIPLALIALMIAVGTIVGFSRLVVLPLRNLQSAANTIATGKFDTHIDNRYTNEIGELARAIDSMRGDLWNSFRIANEEKERVLVTLNSIADGVITVNTKGQISFLNPVAEKETGWKQSDAKGRPVEIVFNAHEGENYKPVSRSELMGVKSAKKSLMDDTQLLRRSGTTIPIDFRSAPLVTKNGTNFGAVLVFSNLTEKSKLRSELLHHATHDSLTGLANRREFERRVQLAIDSASFRNTAHAVSYLDLDQFKVVNDTCGHVAGDELLRQIALLFKKEVRSGDTLARLGGDEFGILLEHCTVEDAVRLTNQLLDAMKSYRFYWEDKIFSVGVSVGLAPINCDSRSVVAVIRDADSGCYLAKESGRNHVRLYSEDDEEMQERLGQMQWVDKIDRALENDEFELYGQTIEPLQGNGSTRKHFEVLLRMIDDQGNLIAPGLFLPAAERFGLATKIDQWVVSHTLDWLVDYTNQMSDIDLCSINLSGQSIGDKNFLPFVVDLLEKNKGIAGKVCFEITETASIANLSHAMVLIQKLKALGCRFALDDFGSGLSSFAYLKNLPVDYLKIDGVFVKDIVENKLDFAMVRSIVEISNIMGKQTIAEFVENDLIKEKLDSIGVNYVQGYGIEKPKPLDELMPVMDQTKVG